MATTGLNNWDDDEPDAEELRADREDGIVYGALLMIVLGCALVAAALVYVWFASHPLAL